MVVLRICLPGKGSLKVLQAVTDRAAESPCAVNQTGSTPVTGLSGLWVCFMRAVTGIKGTSFSEGIPRCGSWI